MTGVDAAPDGGVDLSRLFGGRNPPKRGFAYGGYRNSHYLRNDRWTFFADNRMQNPKLYDRRRDPAEVHDVAHRHPELVRKLHAKAVEEATGGCPSTPASEGHENGPVLRTRREFVIGGAAAGAAAYVALRGTAGTSPSEKPKILISARRHRRGH